MKAISTILIFLGIWNCILTMYVVNHDRAINETIKVIDKLIKVLDKTIDAINELRNK